jgi:hypothetical protein
VTNVRGIVDVIDRCRDVETTHPVRVLTV